MSDLISSDSTSSGQPEPSELVKDDDRFYVVDDDEYVSIPEDALQFLPEEWRDQIEGLAANGRAVLRSVDDDLSRISRLASAYIDLVSLKHIQRRLSKHRFEASMDHFLDLDMMTLAFVVTYARLHEGGAGSGFARGNLPPELRPLHDNIIELRNKRFAHNTGHHTVSDALEIMSDVSGEWFKVRIGYSLMFQVGGEPRWKELITALESIFVDRMEKLLARITQKTGREWSIESGPPPDEDDE